MTEPHPIFSILLTVLQGETATEGPGWYIIANSPASKLPPRRVNSTQAEEIGRAFEAAIPPGDETILLHPFEVVKAGTEAAMSAVRLELQEAEEAAKRVAGLRRLLGDLDDG